jgi:GNAT superfamily N-acetyltransferase
MPGRRPTPAGPDVQFERLRDGADVNFVSMSPDDAERLVRFHHDLSPESVYLRFFTCHPELDPSELYRFTHVDHRDREAIIAVADGEIVAVARFDRLERTDAEVAFVVADAWQGRGLGSLLFDRIAARARAVGIERIVAATLTHNARMLAIFRDSGLPMTTHHDGEVVDVTIDLTPRDIAVPRPALP